MWKQVAMQTSLIAGVGGGLYFMRRTLTPRMHPLVSAKSKIVKRQPALAACLSELGELKDCANFSKIVDLVDEIVSLDEEHKPDHQHRIVRLNGSVMAHARQLCTNNVGHVTEEDYRRSIGCERDVLPHLQNMLDDLLHNHLLACKHY